MTVQFGMKFITPIFVLKLFALTLQNWLVDVRNSLIDLHKVLYQYLYNPLSLSWFVCQIMNKSALFIIRLKQRQTLGHVVGEQVKLDIVKTAADVFGKYRLCMPKSGDDLWKVLLKFVINYRCRFNSCFQGVWLVPHAGLQLTVNTQVLVDLALCLVIIIF